MASSPDWDVLRRLKMVETTVHICMDIFTSTFREDTQIEVSTRTCALIRILTCARGVMEQNLLPEIRLLLWITIFLYQEMVISTMKA